jgi:hypothetical protein
MSLLGGLAVGRGSDPISGWIRREERVNVRHISGWLDRVSEGWVALVALVIFLLFTALVLPDQAARAEAYSAEAGSPDSSFWYSSGELYQFAEAYGEQGRRAYVRARFTFDVAWPLVYTFFLTTAISWVYARTFSPGSWPRRANLVPVVGMGFDFLENISTSLVMSRYPAPTPGAVQLAPIFTTVKWIFVNGSFVVLLVGVVLAVGKWAQKRR